MTVTLADLLTPSTEAQTEAQILEWLTSVGFTGTSWQEGSWQRHIVKAFARLLADGTATVPLTAALGLIRLATGDAKTLVAREVYDTERVAAVKTQGQMVLTSSAGAPLHTIAIGDLVLADAATDPANTYRNTTGGALAPGGTLTLEWEAETGGAAANIASGTTLYLWTPLVGVTATNPAIGGTGTWITRAGVDVESDARLEARALGQLDALAYGATEGAYAVWALEPDPTITRVRVRDNNPFGPNTIDVIIATAAGVPSAGQVTTVSDYIVDGINPDGSITGRRPLNDDVTVRGAVVLGQLITATVTVDAASSTVTDVAAVTAALTAFIATLPIGGVVIPPASAGVLVRAELIAAIMALDGVINVAMSAPSGDVTYPDVDRVLVPSFAITVVYV